MDRVKSLSISENMASTSPLCSLSGGLSRCHLVILANPCCGPKDHAPNWAKMVAKNELIAEQSCWILADLRKTKGIPPRIAFLPSNEASLLWKNKMGLSQKKEKEKEKARLIRLDATRKYSSHKNACRPRQTFRNSEMLLAEKSVWQNAPCPFLCVCVCVLFFSCRWGWRCREMGLALGFVSANLPTHPSSNSFCPGIYLSCSSMFCASFVNVFSCGSHWAWPNFINILRFQLGIYLKAEELLTVFEIVALKNIYKEFTIKDSRNYTSCFVI